MRPQTVEKLQDYCIDSILRSFPQLIALYNSGCGNIPARHFEFLQRMYSKVILDRLNAKFPIERTYLPFLINPHLKELNLTSKWYNYLDDILERLRLVGNNIICLNLSETPFSETGILDMIKLLPNVQELYISQTESSNEVLRIIGQNCLQLRLLDMNYSSVTDEGLFSLCPNLENNDFLPNTQLTKLYIMNTSISEKGVAFLLKYLPNLEVLDHESLGNAICRCHIHHFINGTLNEQPTYNLTRLEFLYLKTQLFTGSLSDINEQFDQTDVLAICASRCPRVSTLHIDNLMVPSSILACCKFTQLTDASLTASHSADYTPFLELQGYMLVHLKLCNGCLSVETLAKNCQILESLDLQSIMFQKFCSDSSVDDHRMPKLTSLILEGYDFVPESLEPVIFLFGCCPDLEILRFPYCRSLSEDFVSAVLSCKFTKTLQKLDCTYSDLSFESAQKLLISMPNLEKMIIESCNISSDEYEIIQTFVKAENLGIEVVLLIDSIDYDTNDDFEYEFSHFGYSIHNFEYDFDDLEYMNYYDNDFYDDYDDDDSNYEDDDDDAGMTFD